MRYKLNETDINAACEAADAYLVKKKVQSKDRIHTKLSIEEILLNYKGIIGTDAGFAMDFGGGISKNRIRLTVLGSSADPFNPDHGKRTYKNGAASKMEVCAWRQHDHDHGGKKRPS